MIHFQETMLQMTTKFLSSQQAVMLCYLQSVPNSEEKISLGQVSTTFLSPWPTPPAEELPDTETKPEPETKTETETERTIIVLPAQIFKEPGHDALTKSIEEFDGPQDTDALIASLLEIVSERTGYPVEMLDPNLDLETDLGIDSIKRIEILNKFQNVLMPERKALLESSIEELAGARTLNQIIEWIVKPTKKLSVDD